MPESRCGKLLANLFVDRRYDLNIVCCDLTGLRAQHYDPIEV